MQQYCYYFYYQYFSLINIRVYFLRADALRDKQSTIKEKSSKQETLEQQTQVGNDSDSDDSDFDEFLDWRAKKVSWWTAGLFCSLLVFYNASGSSTLLLFLICGRFNLPLKDQKRFHWNWAFVSMGHIVDAGVIQGASLSGVYRRIVVRWR